MPRNASGVYSLPESPFVAGTTIESDPMNSNLSDIATALTQSLDIGGTTSLTGPLKLATGSESAPSLTFSAAQGTGFYLSSTNEIGWTANGVLRGVFGATGVVDFDVIRGAGNASFAGNVSITGAFGGLGNSFAGGYFAQLNGSVAAPAYSFSGNTGTGLFISATNQLSIAAASVSVVTVRASTTVAFVGNVTIGGNLEVVGSISSGNAASQQTFNSSDTWTKPSTGTIARIQCWGAGGGGGTGGSSDPGGGGGGGGYKEITVLLSSLGPTETVTIGAGGAGGTSGAAGGVGGNTSFGAHLTAFGGGGGYGDTNASNGHGGGGGGLTSAGSTANSSGPGDGGEPEGGSIVFVTDGVGGAVNIRPDSPSGGGGGGSGSSATGTENGGSSFWGGGGGAGSTGGDGGGSVWGGGGGGTGSAGASVFGGSGGTAGNVGTAPGGGGGGDNGVVAGAAGAAGRVIVTVW